MAYKCNDWLEFSPRVSWHKNPQGRDNRPDFPIRTNCQKYICSDIAVTVIVDEDVNMTKCNWRYLKRYSGTFLNYHLYRRPPLHKDHLKMRIYALISTYLKHTNATIIFNFTITKNIKCTGSPVSIRLYSSVTLGGIGYFHRQWSRPIISKGANLDDGILDYSHA